MTVILTIRSHIYSLIQHTTIWNNYDFHINYSSFPSLYSIITIYTPCIHHFTLSIPFYSPILTTFIENSFSWLFPNLPPLWRPIHDSSLLHHFFLDYFFFRIIYLLLHHLHPWRLKTRTPQTRPSTFIMYQVWLPSFTIMITN